MVETAQLPSDCPLTTARSDLGGVLDFVAALKASQTLSQDLEFDSLVATLLNTVIETAGADRIALLMPHENQWFVGAVMMTGQPAQVSISLENSRLYRQVGEYSHTLETEVERKTQDLNQKNQDLEAALKDLKQPQGQLIQSEKMSSLGQMVAGVALVDDK